MLNQAVSWLATCTAELMHMHSADDVGLAMRRWLRAAWRDDVRLDMVRTMPPAASAQRLGLLHIQDQWWSLIWQAPQAPTAQSREALEALMTVVQAWAERQAAAPGWWAPARVAAAGFAPHDWWPWQQAVQAAVAHASAHESQLVLLALDFSPLAHLQALPVVWARTLQNMRHLLRRRDVWVQIHPGQAGLIMQGMRQPSDACAVIARLQGLLQAEPMWVRQSVRLQVGCVAYPLHGRHAAALVEMALHRLHAALDEELVSMAGQARHVFTTDNDTTGQSR